MLERPTNNDRAKGAEQDFQRLFHAMEKIFDIHVPSNSYKLEWLSDDSNSGPGFGVKMSGEPVISMRINDLYGEWGAVEEIGHFFRHRMAPVETKTFPKLEEMQIQEFFGFMARRIAHERMTGAEKKMFADFPIDSSFSVPIETIDELRASSRRFYEAVAQGKLSSIANDVKLFQDLDRLRDIEEHVGPYEFALRIPLKNLDVRKLFSLSDEEVRERFFKADQKLGGLFIENGEQADPTAS